MTYLTEDKLAILGSAGAIGSNMVQTSLTMGLTPYVAMYDPYDKGNEGAAEEIYLALGTAGIDVILDDRSERPGVKFNDAELIGIPLRITVGPRGLAAGEVELTERASGTTESVPVDVIVAQVVERVLAAR